jgi:hypothetical protein
MKKAVLIKDNYDFNGQIVGFYDYDKLPKHIKANVDAALASKTPLVINSIESGLEWCEDSANNVDIEDYEIMPGENVEFIGIVIFTFE